MLHSNLSTIRTKQNKTEKQQPLEDSSMLGNEIVVEFKDCLTADKTNCRYKHLVYII